MPDYDQSEDKNSPLTARQVIELLEELRSHFAVRNSTYQDRRGLYRGEHWGSQQLRMPAGAGRTQYTLVANYIRPIVDKDVQTLFGSLPGIQVIPPTPDEAGGAVAEQEEGLLYATWNFNNAEQTFRRLGHNMALLDQGVLYYWWDPKQDRVRFRSVAPDNFYPLYDGEDLIECILVSRRLTRQLKRSYPKLASKIVADQGADGGAQYFDQHSAETGGLFDSTRFDGDNVVAPLDSGTDMAGFTTVIDWYDRDGHWIRIMGNAVHKQNLEYGTGVPVIVFPNSISGENEAGPSEIHDVIELNLYLDQLFSQSADILKRFANPTILDKQSGQEAHLIRQTIQAEGGVLPIKKDGDIKYLNWEGTAPDLQNQWVRSLNLLYDISGKPASSFGQILSNQSGTASNMALSPISTSTEAKQGVTGNALMRLNQVILQLNEKFMSGSPIDLRTSAPKRPGIKAMRSYSVQMDGAAINGWYENRIKWPSVLRTDDPVYVQNEMAKGKADPNNPQIQSHYTTMENLGIEDVEKERSMIAGELEDPRLHPERMTAAINAATQMGESMVGAGMEGFDPAGAQIGGDPQLDAALNASGNPNGSKSTKTPRT